MRKTSLPPFLPLSPTLSPPLPFSLLSSLPPSPLPSLPPSSLLPPPSLPPTSQALHYLLPIFQALHYLVLISEVEEKEIFKICLEYWNSLAGDLYRENPFSTSHSPMLLAQQSLPPRRQLYLPVLSKVCVCVCVCMCVCVGWCVCVC